MRYSLYKDPTDRTSITLLMDLNTISIYLAGYSQYGKKGNGKESFSTCEEEEKVVNPGLE